MAAYSLDLRTRMLADWDAGLGAEQVAAKYRVSRAWVDRLVQRRRETGEIGPRRQTKFRGRALAADQEARLLTLVTPRSPTARWPSYAKRSQLGESHDDLARAGPIEIHRQKNGTRRRTTSS